MEDYPLSLGEFAERFATEAACRAYRQELRWPDGFRCPSCRGQRAWPTGRGELMECSSCHRQISVTAGTIFEGTRKPLLMWFRAIWWVTNQKTGVSALGLKRLLGLGSYQTAWAWLHKLRRAMVRPGRERLSGRVEIDETYVGGHQTERGGGARGRGTTRKTLVVIAAEEDGAGIGRIRMQRIAGASTANLERFIRASVEPGSLIHTDGWRGYARIQTLGYVHKVTTIKHAAHPADEVMPRVHRVASLLKRWLLGTHQGAVSHGHLDYYLDEFTFRFNRRKSQSRGKLFYRLVQQAVAIDPVPYANLVSKSDGKPQHVGAT
ncbi:MAG: IS1595 family transposase [Isosphaeraceae bacterium]